jgi:hypothetical protein
MNCPAEETLFLSELGELPYRQTLEIREHEAECTRCRERLRAERQLLTDLTSPPAFERSAPDFAAAVLERCAASDAEPRPPVRARSRAPLYGALLLAASLCVWLMRPAPPAPHFAARGGRHAALGEVRVEPRLVRGGALMPLEGAELRAGDGITARYFKQGERAEYLALFAVDAQGAVHWIFPAYLEPASNPTSIALAPSPTGHLLEDTVEPEAPAAGRLRVVAIVSREPLSVREIEHRLVQKGLNRQAMAEIFPSDQVQEWSATWASH